MRAGNFFSVIMMSAGLLMAGPVLAQMPGETTAVQSGTAQAMPPGFGDETAAPDPVAKIGDIAIYEPGIVIDPQHPEHQFLSMVIENRGNKLQRLTGAKIDSIGATQPVVAVWQENDVQLINIDQIGVNARETVSVGPDSLALQIAPGTALKQGAKYTIRVEFAPAGTVTFPASVTAMDAGGGDPGAGFDAISGRPE